jgi:TetR/AcrR family transcriptional regulator, cholesterol catabolism regulator
VETPTNLDGKAPSDQRQPSRRDEILTTAAELFWAKGYSATAMSDLAAELGIRKASLYHYVPAKEALLYELSIESTRRMIEAATSVSTLAPVPYLEALIRTHLLTLLGDQNTHATALTELRSLSPQERQHVTDLRDRYDRLIEEAIRSVQAATGLWPGISPKLLRLSLLGMLNWTVFWYRPGGALTPEDLSTSYARIFLGSSEVQSSLAAADGSS